MQVNDTFQFESSNEIGESSSQGVYEIDIVIKTISNSVYNFKIGTDTTIAELKDLIQTATEVAADRQRLIYRGRVLVNESAVSEYRIENGHTIHMVAKPLNLPAPSPSDSSSSNNNRIQNQSSANAISSILPGIATAVNGSVENSGSAVNNNIEHIRQGLLSIHTLISTMDPNDFSYNDNNNSEAKNMNGVDSIRIPVDGSNASAIDWISSTFPNENGEGTTNSSSMKDDDKSRPSKRGRSEVNLHNNDSNLKISQDTSSAVDRTKRFFRGQWVDVKDTVSQWLEATIMDIDYENFKVYVHYNGW